MAERTSVALRPRDLVRVGLTVTARTGTDMLQTRNGWLFRCYRDGESVIVERSLDEGKTWNGIGVGTSRQAIPTLAADRWDRIWCWFNDLTTSYGYLSSDYGETWTLHGQHLGGAPRMEVLPERSFMVIHDGLETLTVYRTEDGGATILPVYGQTCPAQVGALRADRYGLVHLVYKDADNNLWHRLADDPDDGNFGSAASWGTGRFHTLALGMEHGIIAAWDGSTLKLQRTDATFSQLAGLASSPATTYTPGYTGILIDRRSRNWLTPKPAGAPVTSIWSADSLAAWSDP